MAKVDKNCKVHTLLHITRPNGDRDDVVWPHSPMISDTRLASIRKATKEAGKGIVTGSTLVDTRAKTNLSAKQANANFHNGVRCGTSSYDTEKMMAHGENFN